MSDTFDHYFDATSSMISAWEETGDVYGGYTRTGIRDTLFDFKERFRRKVQKMDSGHLRNYYNGIISGKFSSGAFKDSVRKEIILVTLEERGER